MSSRFGLVRKLPDPCELAPVRKILGQAKSARPRNPGSNADMDSSYCHSNFSFKNNGRPRLCLVFEHLLMHLRPVHVPARWFANLANDTTTRISSLKEATMVLAPTSQSEATTAGTCFVSVVCNMHIICIAHCFAMPVPLFTIILHRLATSSIVASVSIDLVV